VYRLSIIVPLLDDNEQFEDTLVSVLQNRPVQSEVLVVHRGSYDDPYQLRDEVHFVPTGQSASVVAMLNAGIEAAAGEIVHVLLPGVLARQDWAEPAVDRFRQPDVAAVAPVICSSQDADRVLTAGVRYTAGGGRILHAAGRQLSRSSRLLRRKIDAAALPAAFYRRSVLGVLGGLDEGCGPSWTDIDFALSSKCLGYRCVLEPDCQVSAGVAALANPVGYQAGRGAERTFWRHIGSRGWLRSLALHPLTVVASVLAHGNRAGGYTQVLGRAVSALNCLGHASHTKRLREMAAELDEQNEAYPDPGEWTGGRSGESADSFCRRAA
jgi:hypothetical protein